MNSYPPELLAQLGPVMFVAGLDTPPSSASSQSPSPKPQDPFTVLAVRLRDALISQRKVAIWQPDKSKTFQVILVDPDVRFPPRKIAPAEDQQFHTPHSPLSPLTPSSPLHPDGLIAPIWIRKHTTLVPSVFVLFKRIYEHPRPSSQNPLDLYDPEREREREAEERKRDAELSAEIAQRKKSTNERSIKLTVVLMASRRLLDDPALDARLTFIRRQSGLDPRAALFVLSPVTPNEIGEFVRSLQEALWEPAIEYYTNHSKRVRRKRNRHAQTLTAYQPPQTPMGSTYAPRPLRPEGWTVRYEYKMGCFAEFRGEDDVALKHYHDAYSALHIMFGSTAILPPRTKRWAEAKVLADCTSVKICKLYLYNNEHAMALAHHNSHMRMFSDLSRGWGIGEETFEFWSWMARQHRIFAELLEQGTRSTLQIPTHLPTPDSSKARPQDLQRGSLEIDAMRALGLNPTQALQHPGFYYYIAARCTENRRNRFLAAIEDESSHLATSPGFVNERKVDHLSIVLELYTRAYELFKRYHTSSTQGRLTLWIAYLIAQTYYQSGKFEMAVRFFERIAKTYRREQWDALLRPLLSTWYRCAQRLGNIELSVQLLFEILGHGPLDEQDDPEGLEEDLLAVLKSTVPSSNQVLTVDLTEAGPLLDTSSIFWKPHVDVDEPAAFQIVFTVPQMVSLVSLPFTSLTIQLSGVLPPINVEHDTTTSNEGVPPLQKVDLGSFSAPTAEEDDAAKVVTASLRWKPGSSIVLCGSLTSSIPRTLTIVQLALTLKEGSWNIDLPLQPNSRRPGTITNPRWLSSLNPVRWIPVRRDNYASATVRHRLHQVQVSLSNQSPAYLGEEFPIILDITNTDDRDLDIVLDILLQPTEIEEADNFISLEDQKSNSLIKGVALGVLPPGVKVIKTLYLMCSGAVGDRVIDISARSRLTTSASPTTPDTPQSPSTSSVHDMETLRTLVVPTVDPIDVKQGISYKRSTRPSSGLGNLDTFESNYWDDAGEAHVTTTMTCVGPSGISVESIKLLREDNQHAKVIDSLVDQAEEDFCTEWLNGDEFCDQCRVSLARPDEPLQTAHIPSAGIYEVSWRRLFSADRRGSLAKTRFSLPPLKPPSDGLVALLDVPNTAKLHEPIPLTLTIRNGHPSRSANIIVQLEPDPVIDGFVVAGLRHGRLPILLPGGEEVVRWNLIPVECGWIKAPKVKVMNRRPAFPPAQSQSQSQDSEVEGEIVEIVDVRWDGRSDEPVRTSVEVGGKSVEVSKVEAPAEHPRSEAVVLVLP